MKKIIYQDHGPNPEIDVHLSGWVLEGHPYHCFDSYISALAFQSGYWEEYCEHHRIKRDKNVKKIKET